MRSGEFDVLVDDGNEATHTVETLITHSMYRKDTYNNDIALIKLATPIKFSRFILPACLPDPVFAEKVNFLSTHLNRRSFDAVKCRIVSALRTHVSTVNMNQEQVSLAYCKKDKLLTLAQFKGKKVFLPAAHRFIIYIPFSFANKSANIKQFLDLSWLLGNPCRCQEVMSSSREIVPNPINGILRCLEFI